MVAIGCDAAAFSLKQALIKVLEQEGIKWMDVGCFSQEVVDYPDVAGEVIKSLLCKQSDRGVLLCGTGIGMSMVANRFEGIRCAVCTDSYMARMCRAHNDANVLAMGARVIGEGVAQDILLTFLATAFEGGRHAHRVAKIETIHGENS